MKFFRGKGGKVLMIIMTLLTAIGVIAATLRF